MRKLVLAAALLASTALSAQAEVLRVDHLSGTGDNVVFDSIANGVAKATFNGPHTGFATFTDLSGNPLFTGAANGNDIKISNTNDLSVQVFNTNGSALGTTTDVFSLKGTGDVIASFFAVDANGNAEAAQIFDLGTIDPNAQSGFTFSTINGEVITRFVLLDAAGMIKDFEHYRIDAAPIPQMTPVPIPGAAVLFVSGMIGIGMISRRRRKANTDTVTS